MFFTRKKGQQTINTSKNFLVVERGKNHHPLEFSIRTMVEKFPREVVFIREQNNSIEKIAVMTRVSEGGRGCCLSNVLTQLGGGI